MIPRWKLVAYILFMRGYTFRGIGRRIGKSARDVEQAFRDVAKAYPAARAWR